MIYTWHYLCKPDLERSHSYITCICLKFTWPQLGKECKVPPVTWVTHISANLLSLGYKISVQLWSGYSVSDIHFSQTTLWGGIIMIESSHSSNFSIILFYWKSNNGWSLFSAEIWIGIFEWQSPRQSCCIFVLLIIYVSVLLWPICLYTVFVVMYRWRTLPKYKFTCTSISMIPPVGMVCSEHVLFMYNRPCFVQLQIYPTSLVSYWLCILVLKYKFMHEDGTFSFSRKQNWVKQNCVQC